MADDKTFTLNGQNVPVVLLDAVLEAAPNISTNDAMSILLAVRPLIEAAEREACAKRIEALGAQNSGRYAAAIRSRSTPQSGR